MNTQCSTQWDSLVHWQHQSSGLAYNGAKPTAEDLSKATTAENEMPTLDHWHARGGLVARGVLVDYKRYAEERGLPLSGPVRLTVADIEAAAAAQSVEFRPGDVFFIRTGFTEVIDRSTLMMLMGTMVLGFIGVHGCEETARWFWDKRFAAVASDTPSFEAYPPVKEDGSPATPDELGK